MISSYIENILKGVTTNTITEIFIYVMIILFGIATYSIKKQENIKFISYAPNLLTSVGILGTFTGIVIGLFDFNPQDIDKSIPLLLEGLKTAFITSIVGILLSIILKFISSMKKEDSNTKEEVLINDIYTVMQQQNENLTIIKKSFNDDTESSMIGQVKLLRSDISDNNKQINKSLLNGISKIEDIYSVIQKSFNDDTESSMIGQVKLLRSDISDNNKQINRTMFLLNEGIVKLVQAVNEEKETFLKFQEHLWIKLQDFADMLSKSATEQVIEALNNVIKDFNDKLTEQFGENFKELNNAVHKLVDWQENYKNQLEDMKKQFNLSVDSMGIMEKSVESISTNTESIPKSMNELQTIIKTNQQQVEELNRHLEAFKEIKEKAVEAVPEIRNQIDITIKGIQDASTELINGVGMGAEKMSSAIIQSADEFANNVSATNGALIESSNTLTKNSTDIKEQLEATVLDINKHVRKMIEDMINNNSEVSSQFKDAGKILLEELNSNSSQIQKGLKEITSNLQDNIEDLANEQMKQVQIVMDSLGKTIEQTLNKTGESVKNQVEMIDKVAEKEIENVMNAMGSALTTITKQFTSDYQKLVNEMKQITNAHR